MVSIIGKDNSAVKQITCKNCASRLEYTPSEVKERHGKDYTGGADGAEWIKCPSCGDRVIINSW